MDPLKMYFLLKMGIFHFYVSLPEGKGQLIYVRTDDAWKIYLAFDKALKKPG